MSTDLVTLVLVRSAPDAHERAIFQGDLQAGVHDRAPLAEGDRDIPGSGVAHADRKEDVSRSFSALGRGPFSMTENTLVGQVEIGVFVELCRRGELGAGHSQSFLVVDAGCVSLSEDRSRY